MQAISEEKIQEIRNSADIVSIISDYIPLKPQGKNYFGVCPFHDDHRPSMSVSKDRQLFKCFVCNKGGNVFTFVKDYENISYIEAVIKVANKVGIPISYTPVKGNDEKHKLEYEIMDFTTSIYQNNLNSKEGIKAKEYLEKRNITSSIIKEFKIGYALNDSNYLANVLKKKGYPDTKLDELGLINKDGINTYDRFQNRIMIPITNLDGKVVGFTGRIFNGEDSAKYINTKETSIYKKGKIIFNYYNALPYIRESKSTILVEGNMDAIRMYSAGVKNVLALMGTTLTKDQIEILKKLRVPITLMLDNDNAGEIATNNIGDELIKNNILVKVVRLKRAKDPDEYIVSFGIDAFKDTLNNSLSYLDYKIDYLKNNKNLGNTIELVSYIKDVIKLLDNEDNLTKEVILKKLSTEYNLDYEMLKKEVTFKEEVKKEPVKVVKKNKYEKCVNNILYYLMSDSKYIKIFNKKLGFLKNADERNLVTEIEYYIDNYGKINLADFMSYAESNDKIKDLVHNIVNYIAFDDLQDEIFLDYIEALNNMLMKENIKDIKEKIIKSNDINEQIENINKQIDLKKKIINENEDV